MALMNDAARRQLAQYVRNCLASPSAHVLEAAALSQLDVLRGEAEEDEFGEPPAADRRRRVNNASSIEPLRGFGRD